MAGVFLFQMSQCVFIVKVMSCRGIFYMRNYSPLCLTRASWQTSSIRFIILYIPRLHLFVNNLRRRNNLFSFSPASFIKCRKLEVMNLSHLYRPLRIHSTKKYHLQPRLSFFKKIFGGSVTSCMF